MTCKNEITKDKRRYSRLKTFFREGENESKSAEKSSLATANPSLMAIKNERDWVNHKPLCWKWVTEWCGVGRQGEQEDWDGARLKCNLGKGVKRIK